MKVYRLAAAGLALGLLTGCASLLERSYTTSEPHSSKFWESEAAATLRAENRQDMVNDLLILIGQHTETASLRLYNFPDEQTALEELEKAAQEVQQETPLGAYAVEYITYISQPQRSYYEINVQIGYRRSEEQIQTIVNATSFTAQGPAGSCAGRRPGGPLRLGAASAAGARRGGLPPQQLRGLRGAAAGGDHPDVFPPRRALAARHGGVSDASAADAGKAHGRIAPTGSSGRETERYRLLFMPAAVTMK